MSWQEQLEELEKSLLAKGFDKKKDDDEDDDEPEYDGDGDGEVGEDEDDEEEPQEKRVKKGISGTSGAPKGSKTKGCYPPAEQGEDADPNEEHSTNQNKAKVHDGNSIEKKTRGGKVGWGSRTRVRKSVTEGLEEDTTEAIEMSDILTDFTKSIESLAEAGAADVQQLTARVQGLSKSVNAIGKALVVALNQNAQIAKSLSQRVEAVEAAPAGRRSIVKGVQKSFVGQDQGEPDTYEGIMEKAVAAFKAGKITHYDVTKLETDLQHGVINKSLLAKINKKSD
jgi:hypothetical protein